jgi:hypothetical protein
MMLPFWLNIVGRTGTGMGLPCSCFRRGLGSKVSTCETPPDMKQKMTLFTFGGKCGGRGANGLSLAAAASASEDFASGHQPGQRGTRPKPVEQLREHVAPRDPLRAGAGRVGIDQST